MNYFFRMRKKSIASLKKVDHSERKTERGRERERVRRRE